MVNHAQIVCLALSGQNVIVGAVPTLDQGKGCVMEIDKRKANKELDPVAVLAELAEMEPRQGMELACVLFANARLTYTLKAVMALVPCPDCDGGRVSCSECNEEIEGVTCEPAQCPRCPTCKGTGQRWPG